MENAERNKPALAYAYFNISVLSGIIDAFSNVF